MLSDLQKLYIVTTTQLGDYYYHIHRKTYKLHHHTLTFYNREIILL